MPALIFYIYLFYIISFFLHLSVRIPGVAVIRPDLMMAIIISTLLLFNSNKLAGRLNDPVSKSLNRIFIYIIISLPLVKWPGSVIQANMIPFVKVLAFFYFTVLIVDTIYRLKLFISVFIWCQLFRVLEPLGLNILYGYWGSDTFIGGGEFANRLAGAPSDVVNPNGLAFVIAIVFAFIHYVLGYTTFKSKVISSLTIPPLFYALVLTMSRSGFVAVLVVMWDIFRNSRHKFSLIILAFIGAFMLWINMTDIQKERYLSMTGREDVRGASSFEGRLGGFNANASVALKRPIVGYGVGTSREATFHSGQYARLSHIFYLEAWIELGIIGLIMYLVFIKAIHNYLKRVLNRLESSFSKEFPGDNDDRETLKNVKYLQQLYKAVNACFWMFLIFSFAQYGVTQYHWYMLAGIVVLLYKEVDKVIPNKELPKHLN